MIDYFGDVPYGEAVAGVSNPKRDSGSDVYAATIELLDAAIANLNKESASFYTSNLFNVVDSEDWIRFANTLKLKIYLQSRLVNNGSAAIINAIIQDGNYITAATHDFQFNWSTNDNNPDSKHPIFTRNFDSPGVITNYMSNHFMEELNAGVNDKSVVDPRLRYYYCRQADRNAENTTEQDCFGLLPPTHYGFSIPFFTSNFDGYWGKDFGDDGGIPPDTGFIATWGAYPVGGLFDNNSFEAIVDRSIAIQGTGISPIMLLSFVQFMLAESALTLGTIGDALSYQIEGVTQSIDK